MVVTARQTLRLIRISQFASNELRKFADEQLFSGVCAGSQETMLR